VKFVHCQMVLVSATLKAVCDCVYVSLFVRCVHAVNRKSLSYQHQVDHRHALMRRSVGEGERVTECGVGV